MPARSGTSRWQAPPVLPLTQMVRKRLSNPLAGQPSNFGYFIGPCGLLGSLALASCDRFRGPVACAGPV